MLNSLTVPASASLSALVLGIWEIIFFSFGTTLHPTATPYRIYSCHGNICSEGRERKREREQRRKKKSILSWQRINWFYYSQPSDSFHHRWRGDGGPAEGAVCVWVVINYCWGLGHAGHTPWLSETQLISQPPSLERKGAKTNPIILIKHFSYSRPPCLNQHLGRKGTGMANIDPGEEVERQRQTYHPSVGEELLSPLWGCHPRFHWLTVSRSIESDSVGEARCSCSCGFHFSKIRKKNVQSGISSGRERGMEMWRDVTQTRQR